MSRILIGIIAAVASFMLVESLSCNTCTFGLVGYCIDSSKENCSTNTSVCFTGEATFPKLPTFTGFSSQGCVEPAGCNMTVNSTLLGVTYQTKTECCSSDECNPIQVSGAPSTKMTLTAAAGVALLASMWGSIL